MRDPLPVDPVTPVNSAAIALLERKLAEAKAGKLTSVAIVAAYDGGGLMVDTQGAADLLLLGAVQLQHQLREILFPPATNQGVKLTGPGMPRLSW